MTQKPEWRVQDKLEDLKYSTQMIETKNELERQLTARFKEGLINRLVLIFFFLARFIKSFSTFFKKD